MDTGSLRVSGYIIYGSILDNAKVQKIFLTLCPAIIAEALMICAGIS